MNLSHDISKTEKKLARPDLTLHYQTWGSGRATPPIVLLHGWAGAMGDWSPLEPYLQPEGATTYLAYDAAGFGQSQFPSKEVAAEADYRIERYVEDLRALLDAEGFDTVHLVGHSWGGVIAMSFAARYPARVASLVAIGAAYFDPANRLHVTLKWVSYLIAWLLVLSKGWLRRSPRLRGWAVRRYFAKKPDSATSERLMTEVLAGDNQAILQTLLTGYEVRFKVICPLITSPTLYLGCNKDVVAPPSYVKPFVALTPQAQYRLLTDCGHFPSLEKPAELGQLVSDFWKTV